MSYNPHLEGGFSGWVHQIVRSVECTPFVSEFIPKLNTVNKKEGLLNGKINDYSGFSGKSDSGRG